MFFIPCEGQYPLLMGTGRCGCPLENVQPNPTPLQGRNPRGGSFPSTSEPVPRGTLVDDCRASAKLSLVLEPPPYFFLFHGRFSHPPRAAGAERLTAEPVALSREHGHSGGRSHCFPCRKKGKVEGCGIQWAWIPPPLHLLTLGFCEQVT